MQYLVLKQFKVEPSPKPGYTMLSLSLSSNPDAAPEFITSFITRNNFADSVIKALQRTSRVVLEAAPEVVPPAVNNHQVDMPVGIAPADPETIKAGAKEESHENSL